VILLVEDDPAIGDLVAGILTSAGYCVAVAHSAPAARDVWEDRADEVELLLTDMVLGGSHGGDLIESFRADRADLRVLRMTGYDPQRTGDPGTDGDPILGKPFTPEELLAAVRRLLVS